MARLFGTDGIRGIANQDLSGELAYKIGAVGAYVLAKEAHSPRILVGRDTRKSGSMLSAALSAGICSVGGEVLSVGVLPTPALAYLVRLYEADAAVMVSASHNPMEYNGIKWFDGQGFKLSDELEDKIQELIESGEDLPHPVGSGVGRIMSAAHARQDYCDYLVDQSTGRFEGQRIVLDCANGASAVIAKDVFERLGADVITVFDQPDGTNINDHCGATHPERLQQMVVEHGADLGFAFDGDADRLISCDECGNIVDGDQAMGILALAMKKEGTLKKDTLVLTVMSNLGLKKAMQAAGIHVAETKVGDRYVLEEILDKQYCLGGEQSGHVILRDKSTTGDGMLTAIELLNVVVASKERLSKLAARIPRYPQVLINVELPSHKKEEAMWDARVLDSKAEIEETLGDNGRILLRPSGTEPLIRVMLEGQDEQQIRELALSLAQILVDHHEGKIKG